MPSAVETVRNGLQRYADRGIFRGFGSRERGRSRTEYRFHWHAEKPHVLIFDAQGMSFTFRDLLPDIPYPSPMDRALRRFLAGRQSPQLPEHRRIDAARVRVRAINRGGSVSVELKVHPDDLDYGLKKAVNLVNEIFLSFLAGPYEAYMVRNFGVPEE